MTTTCTSDSGERLCCWPRTHKSVRAASLGYPHKRWWNKVKVVPVKLEGAYKVRLITRTTRLRPRCVRSVCRWALWKNKTDPGMLTIPPTGTFSYYDMWNRRQYFKYRVKINCEHNELGFSNILYNGPTLTHRDMPFPISGVPKHFRSNMSARRVRGILVCCFTGFGCLATSLHCVIWSRAVLNTKTKR
jgi:hypothetical protein